MQPISYGDAKQLLEPLGGPVRPSGFQGGLPFGYHVGGTEAVRVHLKTVMDYKVRKIWNVISRIDGNEEKDRWVIMGNHRDAWTFGAVDPNSGIDCNARSCARIWSTFEEWLEAAPYDRHV